MENTIMTVELKVVMNDGLVVDFKTTASSPVAKEFVSKLSNLWVNQKRLNLYRGGLDKEHLVLKNATQEEVSAEIKRASEIFKKPFTRQWKNQQGITVVDYGSYEHFIYIETVEEA